MNLRSIATFCVHTAILYVLLTEMFSAPFYSDKELSRAREQAVALAREGDFESSLERFAALLSIAPKSKAVLQDYLVVLHWAGEDRKAIDSLARVEKLASLPLYVVREVMSSAINLKDYDSAEQLYYIGLQKTEDIPTYAESFVQRLIADGEFQRAENILTAMLASYPDHRRLLYEMSRLYHFQNRPEAHDTLDQLLALGGADERTIQLWVDNLISQARQGELEQALIRFAFADEHYPNFKRYYGDYAVLLSWAGQYADAYDVSQTLSLDQEPVYILKAVAKAMRETHHYSESANVYSIIVHKQPLDLDSQLGLGLALIDNGQSQDALDVLLPLSRDYPKHRDVLQALAFAYENNDEPLEAGRVYSKLFRMVGSTAFINDWAHNAVAASQSHGLDAVNAQFHEMLKAPAENQNVLNEYILLLLREGKSVEAIKWVAYLDLEQSPDYVIEALAKDARNRQDYKRAQRLYRIGFRRFPRNTQMPVGLALSYTAANQQERAHALLAALVSQYPKNQQILEAFHYHYITFDNKLAAAEVLEQLAALASQNQNYLNRWAEHTVSLIDNSNRKHFLNQFKTMVERYPDHKSLRYDYLSLLAQDGQNRRLLKEADGLDIDTAPAYLIEMLGFAARQSQQPVLAEKIYRIGIERFPNKSLFFVATALSILDQGDQHKAIQLLEDIHAQFGESKDLLFAFAYAYEVEENYIEAMKYYDKILVTWPNNDIAYRKWVISINNSGAPHLAVDKALDKPRLFSRSHWTRFFADRAAVAIRWGQLPGENPKESNRLTDEAIALADQFLEFLGEQPDQDKQSILKAKMDRIIAYRDRGYSHRVIEEYEYLNEATQQLPNFVLNAVADAYLHSEKPEEAKTLLVAALETEPNHHGSLISLFYANLESEEYTEAHNAISKALKQQPIWRTRGDRIHRENGKRFGSERTSTLGVAYANDLDQAQEKLEAFLTEAPHNTDMRSDLGAIYRWRGWPEKSLLEYQLIEPIEPDLLSMEIGMSYTLFDLKEYKQVEKRVNHLARKYPKDKGVENLQEDWELYSSPEFSSHAGWGKSNGSTFGSRDFVIESHLYSSPFKYHYRGFLHHYRAQATFREGKGKLDRVGAGVDVRRRRYDARVELTHSTRGDLDAGLSISSTWRFNDYWSLSGDVQTYSNSTPVRAYFNGIDASSVDVSALYRLNESENYSINIGHMDYSDNNRRDVLGLSHYHTIFQNEHHNLSLTESLGLSSNTELGGPYYSPDKDALLGINAEYKGVLYRRYDFLFQHRLRAGLGQYWQKSHGSSLASNIEYEHRWNKSKALSWYYGVSFASRTYDGSREDNTGFFTGINWKL